MYNYLTINFESEKFSNYSSDKGINILPYVYEIISYFNHGVEHDISVEFMDLELSKIRVIVKDVLIEKNSFLFEIAFRHCVQVYTNMPISHLGTLLTRFKYKADTVSIYLDDLCRSTFTDEDMVYADKVEELFNKQLGNYDGCDHPSKIRGE
jgi:hypothetical protein